MRIVVIRYFTALVTIAFLSSYCTKESNQKYEPSWESLSQYEVPEWFKDAKFGVFLHWGPQSVGFEHNGWVARHLYMQEGAGWGDDYPKHLSHFGHPSEFGYKDLIPLWKAERWDPDVLVAFYKEVGIKYIVPVAVHHDNFDLYHSSYQPWNSVNMGPMRDIMGEWAFAARKHGLKFGVSSHSDRTWYWLHPSKGSDRSGERKGVRYDGWLTKEDGLGTWWEGYDPQDLYAVPNSEDYQSDEYYMSKGIVPTEAYKNNWYLRTKELIDNYQPDLIWFDGPMPMRVHEEASLEDMIRFEAVGLEITAYYYNQRLKLDGVEGVVNIKSWGPGTVVDSGAVVMDIEKGLLDRINPYYWQAETSINGAWFYNGKVDIEMTTQVIIHNLCDIVSKNGNLLLNVGLAPDGTMLDNERQTLMEIGDWLTTHGEGIYETRPWRVFGESDTEIVSGDFKQNVRPMSARDIRYTHKDQILYAFFMDKPENGELRLNTLREQDLGSIRNIVFLSENVGVEWRSDSNGISIVLPDEYRYQHAYAVKIEYKN
jgi:alpha-L-fucosidase